MSHETLKLSQIQTLKENPRKSFDEQSIQGLAESIKTEGLLQNLVVAKPEGKKKKFRLICGERRFRALKLLQEQGDLEKDYQVSVEVREGLNADEILRMATVENIQRENLPPIEEAAALAKLIKDGENLDNIVSQTGLSLHTIRRRLMLLDLTAPAQDALKSGEITLAQAEAVSIGSADDQDRALKQIENGWRDSPEDIKDTIIGRKPSLDLAIFDKALYEGEFISDLLGEENNTFFADVEQFDLLQRNAAEELVEKYEDTHDFAEFEEGYFNRYQYGTAEEGEKGGAVIVLHHSGEVEIHEGLTKPEIDETNIESLSQKKKATYSKPLIENMARHKSIAVQSALLENPRVMKEIIVSRALAEFSYHYQDHSHLSYFDEYENQPTALNHINESAKAVYAIFKEPEEGFSWHHFNDLFHSHEDAYDAVKELSLQELETVHIFLQALRYGLETISSLDTNENSLFNKVALDISVDMRNYWRPDESFLKRRNRDQLMQIIEEAGAKTKYGSAKGYKKSELVQSVAKHFKHVLTLEAPNESDLKAVYWLPEAMQFPAVDPDSVKNDKAEVLDQDNFDSEAYAIAAE